MPITQELLDQLNEAAQDITDAINLIEDLSEKITVELMAEKIEEFVSAKTGNPTKGQQIKETFLAVFDD